jgi:glutamate--cysteine ligase
LIRNFRRHFWLLILLFGASPAITDAFVGHRQHTLERLPNDDGWYRPYATSLRMGDLGYQSSAQDSLFVCYNDKSTYIKTLAKAILSPFEGYQNIPVGDEHGTYHQLSQGLLQIENEFYSSIRPKRSAQSGETALTALHYRGVEYIEVRCLDINPFETLGISKSQVRFLDVFLLYCALADSPITDSDEWLAIAKNQRAVVNEGRKPGLQLTLASGDNVSLNEWASGLFKAMEPVAELLDAAQGGSRSKASLHEHAKLLEDLNQTPSARILQPVLNKSSTLKDAAALQSQKLNAELKLSPLSDINLKRFQDISIESIAQQKDIENQDQDEFESFLKNYFKQYEKLNH